MDISPLLVKFQPYRLKICKMTGKLKKLQVKNCHAGLVAFLTSLQQMINMATILTTHKSHAPIYQLPNIC
jgi:hypothetical protein